jgi:hydrogenase expression/formation protein HypC
MCIGFPMRVVTGDDFAATCERHGACERVSLLLTGPQPPGTIVLVHNATAVRVLDAEEARRISDALDGVAAALDGRAFDHLFADLVEREPELPAHLRPAAASTDVKTDV